MLDSLEIVVVRSRFPENVGMMARACANMGCHRLCLVDPERFDIEKARPLATDQAEGLLHSVRIVPTLAEALAESELVIGTTARVGGWRRGLLRPDEAALEALPLLREGAPVAFVFGNESTGLTNAELELCHRLVTIPTAPPAAGNKAASLNVAQAVLILLYSTFEALQKDKPRRLYTDRGEGSRRIRHEEGERLYETLKETLLAIEYVKPDNPDYFLMPLRRFLGKNSVHRHEMDMVMGICKQIMRLKGKVCNSGLRPLG